MTQPADHPLRVFSEVFKRDGLDAVRSRAAVAAGAEAILGLMDLTTNDRGEPIDVNAQAAAIQAVGAMVAGFTSGKQEVHHYGSVSVDAHLSGTGSTSVRNHHGTLRLVIEPSAETDESPAG